MKRHAPRWLTFTLYVIVGSEALVILVLAIRGATLGNVLSLLGFGS